ncbi:MAG: hypothetical protein IKD81_08030 [Eubacteriaceae bacterium]|nr:hypothetical protein [Eubacteriaceae bacterium]
MNLYPKLLLKTAPSTAAATDGGMILKTFIFAGESFIPRPERAAMFSRILAAVLFISFLSLPARAGSSAS